MKKTFKAFFAAGLILVVVGAVFCFIGHELGASFPSKAMWYSNATKNATFAVDITPVNRQLPSGVTVLSDGSLLTLVNNEGGSGMCC